MMVNDVSSQAHGCVSWLVGWWVCGNQQAQKQMYVQNVHHFPNCQVSRKHRFKNEKEGKGQEWFYFGPYMVSII